MWRVGLAFWLLRVVLPTIVAYWFGRARRTLRLRAGGLDVQRRAADPVTALINVLGWSNAASMLLLLLLVLEILRVFAR